MSSSRASFSRPEKAAIPAALRERRQWVVWRAEPRPGTNGTQAKPAKVPYCASSGRRASVSAPETWATFEYAWRAYAAGEYSGIGFVFTADDPFVGVDLDRCRNPETGELSEWASEIVDSLDSYTEESVSGTGVHVIVLGSLPPGNRRKGQLEVYDRGRYFCMSGKRNPPSPTTIEDREEALLHLHAMQLKGGRSRASKRTRPTRRRTRGRKSLLAQVRKMEFATRFEQLFDLGNTRTHASPSEADFELSCMLATLTNGDPIRMDRLFRESALMRDKWDEPRGQGTYGEGTIRKAIEQSMPRVVLSADLARDLDASEAALAGLRTPQVFQRGRILVRIAREKAPRVAGVLRPKRIPFIATISAIHLRELLGRSATFVRRTGEDGQCRKSLPPKHIADGLLHRNEWVLPVLDGIVEVPTLRADGSLLDAPGYDHASGLFFDPGSARFPKVPGSPGRDEARAALALILDVLHDFPYRSAADRAACISALFTLLARSSIAGPTPMFCFGAPTPGSGKGLQANVVSLIATGRPAPVSVAPVGNQEMRKILTTIGLEGHALVLFDNVQGEFGSSALSAALTAMEIRDRILGISKSVTVPLRLTWLMTGNNVSFKGDLGRRVVPIDIDPEIEAPEERTGFAHPDLQRHVLLNRPRLVVAGLTILRAFIEAGCPSHGSAPLGSFEAWDGLVRAAVIWTMEVDPLATRERIREAGDVDLENLRSLVHAWWDTFGSTPRTLREAISAAAAHPALSDALAAMDRTGGGDLDPRSIGNLLKRRIGRVVGDQRMTRAGERGGSALYAIERIRKPGALRAGAPRGSGGARGSSTRPTHVKSPTPHPGRDDLAHQDHRVPRGDGA